MGYGHPSHAMGIHTSWAYKSQLGGRPDREASVMASIITSITVLPTNIGTGMVSPCLKKNDDGLQFPKVQYHQQTLGHIHAIQSRGSVVLKTYPFYNPYGHRDWFLMDRLMMFLSPGHVFTNFLPDPLVLICPLPDCLSLRIDCISQHLWLQHPKFIRKTCSFIRKTL